LETAHAYSLREPDEQNVAGRFDGTAVETAYFRVIPYRREAEFWMKVEGKDGRPPSETRVSRIVGKSFEQAYLFTGPRGEWRVLPICWSLENQRWDLTDRVLADINGDVKSLPENYDTRLKVFNDGCGQCHATNYSIGYDDQTERYDSHLLEGAVACESCHGPGSAHVSWHLAKTSSNQRAYSAPNRLLHPAKDLNAAQVLATCGRCHYKHEWRYAIDDDPRVGFNEIAVSQNYDGLGFLPDGRLSGLNYHGSTQSQSACFRGGMSCLSCHQMHGGYPRALKWEAKADAACVQCHSRLIANPRAHSHHRETRCVDCHMPKLMTGVLHFMRDHSMQSPEPELTERFGSELAPNACNLCHATEAVAWAKQWKEKWWGAADSPLLKNVGMVLDLRLGRRVESSELVRAAEEPSNRLFFRLTAIRKLAGRHDDIAQASLRRLLADPHEEVRQVACLAIASNPQPEAAELLLRLLDDPVRTVRVEAAYALVRCGWRGSSPAVERCYADALKMLERQRSFGEILERLVLMADALGKTDAMFEWVSLLVKRSEQQPMTMPDVLQRYGRRLLEAGKAQESFRYFTQALEAYHRAPETLRPGAERLLFLDLADALAEQGRLAEAQNYWRYLLRSSRPASIAHQIASLRLPAVEPSAKPKPTLEDSMRQIEKQPGFQEIFRRARWARQRPGSS
jgi:predicted CXXCH cytochrome family protein